MNKQEAIEKIKKQSTQAYDDFAIMRDTAIHIINQIDEPQKPVVPKFEQEKLYTVEIPNPNLTDTVTLLYKENGKVFIGNEFFWDEVPNYKWKNEPENQLTESEIKQDFDWAWQFAKEVKE